MKLRFWPVSGKTKMHRIVTRPRHEKMRCDFFGLGSCEYVLYTWQTNAVSRFLDCSGTSRRKLRPMVRLDAMLQIMWGWREVASKELHQSSPCLRWKGLFCSRRTPGKRALCNQAKLSRSVVFHAFCVTLCSFVAIHFPI